jgi:hypothetical protein
MRSESIIPSYIIPWYKPARFASFCGSDKPRPPMVCVKLPKSVLVVFHPFVEQRSCQILALKGRAGYSLRSAFPLGAQLSSAQVGQGSLLFGMSGVTAHDARYASLKRNERAQSTNGLRAQGRARARAAPKSRALKIGGSLASSSPELTSLDRPALWTVPPEPGFGAEPQFQPRKVSGHV